MAALRLLIYEDTERTIELLDSPMLHENYLIGFTRF